MQLIHLLIYTTGIKIGQALQPVGLTGGIATGKSTVSHLLQQQQSSSKQSSTSGDEKKDTDEVEFVLIDVDGIAHDILLPTYNDSIYDRLVNEFGTDILQDETSHAGEEIIGLTYIVLSIMYQGAVFICSAIT